MHLTLQRVLISSYNTLILHRHETTTKSVIQKSFSNMVILTKFPAKQYWQKLYRKNDSARKRENVKCDRALQITCVHNEEYSLYIGNHVGQVQRASCVLIKGRYSLAYLKMS